MYEGAQSVQRMIDWIEDNLEQTGILEQISKETGYSPWYCSVLFHDIAGTTMKSYAAGRRLARAAEEIRDTRERIIDIAIKYGYSSQEAITRVFKKQYGCTPAVYRRCPVPIPMQTYKVVLFPEYDEKRIRTMEESRLAVSVEYIPAHKFMGVWENKAANYCDFWRFHDCDEVCGIVTSMEKMAHPVVTAHTAGWNRTTGERQYFYGAGVETDYEGPVPEGFELREFPGSYYLVFSYPSFDYMKENGQVMEKVERLAWSYDPVTKGFEWNEEVCQDYQRHFPEKTGYQILRPVKKTDNVML